MPRIPSPNHPSFRLPSISNVTSITKNVKNESITKNVKNDPYRGIDDPDFSDESDDRDMFFDELHAILDEIGTDHITTLTCSLKDFKLMTSGRGFEVKFEMALDQREKLPLLALAVQRLVRLDISKYRKARDAEAR